MQNPQTWRELLNAIIADTQERQRIARELGISPITLNRWVSGESKPRPHNLRSLLQTLPLHRTLLLPLIEEEFRGFSLVAKDDSSVELTTIPVEFYKQVHHTLPYLPEMLRFSSLSDLILQQAIEQLDPQQLGMAIIVACCMPPSSGGKIRSLRVRAGRGKPPWPRDLAQQAVLLGAESLAGHVASSGHMEINQHLSNSLSSAPGYRDEWEESAVAVPIMRAGKIAGSFLVSSTQPNYFLPMHHILIESYAELLALAFEPEDFYSSKLLELWPMPMLEEQRKHFVGFQQKVAQTMYQNNVTMVQAELLVWQTIEQDMFRLHG